MSARVEWKAHFIVNEEYVMTILNKVFADARKLDSSEWAQVSGGDTYCDTGSVPTACSTSCCYVTEGGDPVGSCGGVGSVQDDATTD